MEGWTKTERREGGKERATKNNVDGFGAGTKARGRWEGAERGLLTLFVQLQLRPAGAFLHTKGKMSRENLLSASREEDQITAREQ